MEFIELLKEIEKSKVRYLVVGGVAVNLYGIERPTKDIDLIVYLERKNLLRFCRLMTKLGYVPKVPVKPEEFAEPKNRADWIKNKNMIVFSFYHSKDWMKVIDIFVKHPLPFEPIYKRRQKIPMSGVKISVIGLKDLIKLKRKAGRLQDQSDLQALEKALKINRMKKRMKL